MKKNKKHEIRDKGKRKGNDEGKGGVAIEEKCVLIYYSYNLLFLSHIEINPTPPNHPYNFYKRSSSIIFLNHDIISSYLLALNKPKTINQTIISLGGQDHIRPSQRFLKAHKPH